MDRITESYLRQFATEHGKQTLKDSEQFEHFVAYCIVSSFVSSSVELDELVTGENDCSIDCAAVAIDGELAYTSEEAKSQFANLEGV